MEPAKLLKDLCVLWIAIKHAAVCCFGVVELFFVSEQIQKDTEETHIFLLLVDVSNLEPDVFFCQWSWWIMYNILEALCGISRC
jgi:hypothetical protein